MKPFFHKIFANVCRVFAWPNILWHLLAVVVTYIIVVSDFDWVYFKEFYGLPRAVLFPAILGGSLLPIVLPFVLLIVGKLRRNLKAVAATYTLGQAALLGWLVSCFYKAFTGRIPPEFPQTDSLTGLKDISHGFQFGFWRGGIFWGWPSSHTTVAFAMAVALITLFPNSRAVKIIALLYALYIGLAVSVSIHWFSEFLAGVIIGSVIGYVVGKSFFAKYAHKI